MYININYSINLSCLYADFNSGTKTPCSKANCKYHKCYSAVSDDCYCGYQDAETQCLVSR